MAAGHGCRNGIERQRPPSHPFDDTGGAHNPKRGTARHVMPCRGIMALAPCTDAPTPKASARLPYHFLAVADHNSLVVVANLHAAQVVGVGRNLRPDSGRTYAVGHIGGDLSALGQGRDYVGRRRAGHVADVQLTGKRLVVVVYFHIADIGKGRYDPVYLLLV